MKQILQSLKNGHTSIMDIPVPQVKSGYVLIQTSKSLISPGTEKMLVAFGEASLINKARSQPDKVRMVISKVKTDGLLPTLEAIRHKLEELIPMGYSNVGKVIALGDGVTEFNVGDRVVSNGAHAEVVSVAKNLCCKIPDQVSDDDATFAILGAISLQGIRLLNPLLGETIAVIGLGLIGLLTVQLLRAQGCRVLAIDIDDEKLKLARHFGAETTYNSNSGGSTEVALTALASQFSRNRGVDGVIITCATSSDEPISQAAKISRKRGRIILVGVTGLQLSRADFYEKELRFQVSCAYGPGRYDPHYEEAGHDYPSAYVRFTAQRNFEAFLDMLAQKAISVHSLISHRYAILNAADAYAALMDNQSHTETDKVLGILLDYPTAVELQQQITLVPIASSIASQKERDREQSVKIGFIGAGNYASRILIPAFKKTNARTTMIACERGISGAEVGRRFNIASVTTDTDLLINDPNINTVVIATRHNSHAELVMRAMEAGKHVFVEKPLCMTLSELAAITTIVEQHRHSLLMVGFNRRFAPQIHKIKTLLQQCQQPKAFIVTVNAGHIPKSHWTQDETVGGGRIIGEVCHFIDLLRHLANAAITQFQIICMDKTDVKTDKVSISLTFADGSIGTIHYFANGHVSFPKERLEVYAGGGILQLDNFRRLTSFGWPGFKRLNLWRQDKGQHACARAYVDAITHDKPSPIALDEIIEVARVTIEIAQTATMAGKTYA